MALHSLYTIYSSFTLYWYVYICSFLGSLPFVVSSLQEAFFNCPKILLLCTPETPSYLPYLSLLHSNWRVSSTSTSSTSIWDLKHPFQISPHECQTYVSIFCNTSTTQSFHFPPEESPVITVSVNGTTSYPSIKTKYCILITGKLTKLHQYIGYLQIPRISNKSRHMICSVNLCS